MPIPFNLTERQVNEMVDVLASLPPVTKKPIQTELTERCACGKIVPIASLEELNTGVFKTIGDVCKGCKDGHRLDREYARVVCARCKRIITRIKPATDKTGFQFKAGRTYHLAECGACHEGLQRCPIIEKVLWDKYNRVK